jgi:hypothetical protein
MEVYKDSPQETSPKPSKMSDFHFMGSRLSPFEVQLSLYVLTHTSTVRLEAAAALRRWKINSSCSRLCFRRTCIGSRSRCGS